VAYQAANARTLQGALSYLVFIQCVCNLTLVLAVPVRQNTVQQQRVEAERDDETQGRLRNAALLAAATIA
jgi:hypothetical protein